MGEWILWYSIYSTGSEFCFKNLVCSRCGTHLKLKPLFAKDAAVPLIPKAQVLCLFLHQLPVHLWHICLCHAAKQLHNAVRQQRSSLPTEWLNLGGLGGLCSMKANFFLQVMFLLCVGLIFSTKALANMLLTWGFLQSPCIEGCSCAGSASVVEMKMCIHRWSSREEQWIQKCSLWKPNMLFSCWDIQFSKQDVTWWSYPEQYWDLLLFIFPQKNREPWGHHFAVHLFSYFYLVLFVFSFPQILPPLPVAAQSCASLTFVSCLLSHFLLQNEACEFLGWPFFGLSH